MGAGKAGSGAAAGDAEFVSCAMAEVTASIEKSNSVAGTIFIFMILNRAAMER
jgi:hypothetical protein